MPILARKNGRAALLSEIRRAGEVPRIELSNRTGISRATVTTITAELIQAGLVEEIPRADKQGKAIRGRPRVDLQINANACYVAGAKISGRVLSVVLLDFAGAQVATIATSLPANRLSPEQLAQELGPAMDKLAAQAEISPDQITALGIGIGGVVDADEGLVYWSPSLNARNVPLRSLLSDALPQRVSIDNDANLVAVAEKSFGLGQSHSDFIVITIESGVGMGIILGNQLYRGARGCGAEFGHTKVHLNGALCRCGQRGCLEAYVADYALLREAATVFGSSRLPDNTNVAVEALLSAAKSGDQAAREIVERASSVFAIALANLINIFDPELIILAGEQLKSDHLYADTVIAEMRKLIVQVDKAPPEVVVHKWGNQMFARSAAVYALGLETDRALTTLQDTGKLGETVS